MQAYLSSREIADALRVSERTARRIIRDNMPHLCVGGRQYRVERADFEAYLNRATTIKTKQE